MPRPPENSFEYLLNYSLIDKYVENLCPTSLHPNIVSLLGIPLALLIYRNMVLKNKWWVLALIIIRQHLDALDGAIARKCNKKTEIGGKIDMWVDLFFTVMFIFGFLVSFYPSYKNWKTFVGVFIISWVFFNINTNFDTHEMSTKLGEWHEQNGTVTLIILWLIWIYVVRI